jgi:hypothetical protein
MRKLQFIFSLIIIAVLTSCGHKKILVYASSKILLDGTQKNITISEGTTHNEQELDFSGSGPVTINVQSPSGKYTIEATGEGLFIANLQKDTVVGSYQHIGADNGKVKYTPELLAKAVDSLQQLIAGQNVSAANKNYFIPSGKIGKVTDNINAKIFGPYVTIPSGFDASNIPEVYKFYTNNEVRETIAKLSVIGK